MAVITDARYAECRNNLKIVFLEFFLMQMMH